MLAGDTRSVFTHLLTHRTPTEKQYLWTSRCAAWAARPIHERSLQGKLRVPQLPDRSREPSRVAHSRFMGDPRSSEDRKRKLLDLLTSGVTAPAPAPSSSAYLPTPQGAAVAKTPPASTNATQQPAGGFYREAAVFERNGPDIAVQAEASTQPTSHFLDDEDLEADVENEALLAVTVAVASFPKTARCAPFALLTIVQARTAAASITYLSRASVRRSRTCCQRGGSLPRRQQTCCERADERYAVVVQGLLQGMPALDLDRELAQLEADGHVTVLRFANAAADAGVVLRADLQKVPPTTILPALMVLARQCCLCTWLAGLPRGSVRHAAACIALAASTPFGLALSHTNFSKCRTSSCRCCRARSRRRT